MEFAKEVLAAHWPEWEIVGDKALGEGTYGKVYKIKKTESGIKEQIAALKVIRIRSEKARLPGFVREEEINGIKKENRELADRYIEEINLMYELRGYTNIVSYEDSKVIEDKDGLGITIIIRMELLTPLQEYLKDKKLDSKYVACIGIDICKALEVCKKKDIVHRDIKENNILVSDTGDFKLSDFGTARKTEITLGMKTLDNGTEMYKAPEKAKGHPADIYSLGILLYKLLNNGRFPFEELDNGSGDSNLIEAYNRRHRGEKLPPPCNADDKLSEIILKASEYNVKKRYDSAEKMREDLEAAHPPFSWKKLLCILACICIVAVSGLSVWGIVKNLNSEPGADLPSVGTAETPSASAAVFFGEEGCLEYAEYESHVEITGVLDSTCDIKIPSKINGKDVTAIADNAFYYCYIESIELPKTLRVIGDRAFLGVSGLEKIELPNKLERIGKNSFFSCVDLKRISIPSTLKEIGETAFYDCKSLESFSVDNSNDFYSASDGILYSKDGETLITYPLAKKNTEFTVPSDVKAIERYAFSGSEKLEKVTISASVRTLGEGCFDSCHSLSEVILNNGLVSIEKRAFAECAVTSIVIPDSVEKIGIAAFYNSPLLENVVVGKGAKSVSHSAFMGSAWFENQEGFITVGDGVLIGYNGTERDLIIPEGTKVIECLGHNNEVTTLNLDSNRVDSVKIPDSATKICADIFTYCTPPASLYIPAGVKEIEDGALAYFTGLEEIIIDEDNENFITDENGVIFNKDKTKLVLYPKKNTANSYDIPAGVTEIAAAAFSYCCNLTEVTVPEGVTIIGENAFNDCSELKTVTLPSSLQTLGDKAFASCSYLEEIELPVNLKTIGKETFYFCRELSSITLSSNVESIGEEAFSHCKNLKIINVDPANENFQSIEGVLYNKNATRLVCYPFGRKDTSFTIPDTVITIGVSAFAGNEEIASVVLPKSVKTICEDAFSGCNNLSSVNLSEIARMDSCAFYGCESLKSITLPQRLTVFRKNVFDGCILLENINIPSSLTYIDERAFEGCEKLKIGTLPARVRFIGELAFSRTATEFANIPAKATTGLVPFYNCTKLQSITVDSENEEYMSADGIIYNKDMTVLVFYPAGKTDKRFVVPDTVKEIYSYAFSFNAFVEEVVLPDSVEIISNDTFEYCYSLKAINLHSGIKEMGERAFFNCTSLADISVPDGIELIAYDLFGGCKALKTVRIPASVKVMNNAFSDCSSLESIIVEDGNSMYKSKGGVVFSVDGKKLLFYPSGKKDESYSIPNGVEIVGKGAFSSVDALKTLHLPFTLRTVEDYWILLCDNLESIKADAFSRYFASVDGVLYNKEITKMLFYPEGKNDKEYILPDTVVYVPRDIFEWRFDKPTLVVTNKDCVIADANLSVVYPDGNE